MKKVLVLHLVLFSVLFTQQDTVRSRIPEIELPDFVITGQAQVDVPVQEKATPELITPLSPEFILSRIGVEDLKLEGLTDPTKLQPSILDTSKKYYARAKLVAGLYSLPKTEVFYSGKISSVDINFGGDFENIRDYVKYSRHSLLNLNALGSLIIEKEGEPPARLKLRTDFTRFSYYNFKALNPDSVGKEVNSKFQIKSEFENLFWREFNLSLGGQIEYQSLSRSGFSFFTFSPYGKLKSTFEHFEITANVNPYLYKRSTWKTFNTLILNANGEMYLRRLLKIINIIIGLDYQSERDDGKQFLAPSASLGIGLSDYWSLSLFYSNKLLNYTPSQLWKINPYLDTVNYNYSIERIKNKFGFSTIIYFTHLSNIKLEFARYDVAGKNIFIPKNSVQGFFNIVKRNVEVLDLNTSLFIDLNKSGNFILNINYISSKLKDNTKNTPHTPNLNLNLTYTYKFEFPLYLRLSFLYYSRSYADINNQISIDPTLNLSIGFNYMISDLIDLELGLNNILNKNNERWFNYLQRPFDFELILKLRF